MTDHKTFLLRAAEWQMSRRERRGLSRWPKRATAVGVAIVSTLSAGVAYAAWTSTASGAGAAKAGTVSFTVAGTAPSIPGSNFNSVHPGSVAGGSGDTLGGDLVVSITNNSGFALKATAVQQASNVTVTTPSGTCASDSGTFPNQSSNSAAFIGTQAPAAYGAATTGALANYSLPASVSIPTGTNTITLPNVVGMGSASLTGCQGGTLTMNVTVTASS